MKNNSSILTIGSFDGVHKGHQSLIKETVRKAKEKNAQSIIVTLERPMKNPHSLLTLLDEKILRIEAFLPDQIIIIPVPSEILTLAPSDFFNNFLIGKLNVAEIICGTDFAFGKNKQGNVSWLKKNAPKLGIKITVIETLTLAAQKISSSNIRALLSLGEVEKANKLLGYNFDFSGIPFREKGLGKKLGFPTVNLKVDPSKLLPHGVFISLIK
ncbi:MAG: adenylyltransferase/cytidyltransferase family protein, partial [Elusimicrobiota bacterium]|nr:adenylyltransferase/cytidyltransferase family protein [Elusimicrobiota bacterium]